MTAIIPVGMGEMKTADKTGCLAVYGVGSCVIVSLYDSSRKLGGIVHIMLPDSSGLDPKAINPVKFADLAVGKLAKELTSQGARSEDLCAKMIGGAEMFPPTEDFENNIGRDNTEAVKKALKKLNIPLIAENTGGRRGRSVEFDVTTGIMRLSILGEEVREI